jgi:hypothetical protein
MSKKPGNVASITAPDKDRRIFRKYMLSWESARSWNII